MVDGARTQSHTRRGGRRTHAVAHTLAWNKRTTGPCTLRALATALAAKHHRVGAASNGAKPPKPSVQRPVRVRVFSTAGGPANEDNTYMSRAIFSIMISADAPSSTAILSPAMTAMASSTISFGGDCSAMIPCSIVARIATMTARSAAEAFFCEALSAFRAAFPSLSVSGARGSGKGKGGGGGFSRRIDRVSVVILSVSVGIFWVPTHRTRLSSPPPCQPCSLSSGSFVGNGDSCRGFVDLFPLPLSFFLLTFGDLLPFLRLSLGDFPAPLPLVEDLLFPWPPLLALWLSMPGS